MNPLISIMIHGELFLYQTDKKIAYDVYHQIKEIAEDHSLYLGNPTCVNPSVLAYEFVKSVQRQTGIQLVSVESWPVLEFDPDGKSVQ